MVIFLGLQAVPGLVQARLPALYLSDQQKGPRLFSKGPVVDVFQNQGSARRTQYL
jgi:hypothetical protein